MLDGVEQRVAKRRPPILAAKRAIRVEQQAPFVFPGIVLPVGLVHAFQVVTRGGRQAELSADEILEDGPVAPADRAVRFVADDELEIRRGELVEEPVPGGEAVPEYGLRPSWSAHVPVASGWRPLARSAAASWLRYVYASTSVVSLPFTCHSSTPSPLLPSEKPNTG